MKVKRRVVTTFASKGLDFRSYADACALVEWLNLERSDLRTHQNSAGRAIEILREINVAKKGRPRSARSKHLAEELDRIIEPLRGLRWRFMQTGKGLWYLDQTYSDDANYGLFLVASLSKHGLEWVHRCWCGKWILAHSRRNRFHSEECRKRFWSEQLKTPQGQQRRREYMRKHRALLKRKSTLKRKRGEQNGALQTTRNLPL